MYKIHSLLRYFSTFLSYQKVFKEFSIWKDFREDSKVFKIASFWIGGSGPLNPLRLRRLHVTL